MVGLAASLALRVAGPALLIPGTVLAGAAIMVASVLVPQLVKATGGASWTTGLTTMGFAEGAALGAALYPPAMEWAGLHIALAGWAIPAVAAGSFFVPASRNKQPVTLHQAPRALFTAVGRLGRSQGFSVFRRLCNVVSSGCQPFD